MRILLVYIRGENEKNPHNPTGPAYNLDATAKSIQDGIISRSEEDEVILLSELYDDNRHISKDKLSEFDLYLCDLTTYNPNISYVIGLAEGLAKPVICFMNYDHISLPVLAHNNIMKYSAASLEYDFLVELNNRIDQVKKDPEGSFSNDKKAIKPKAFISYSHSDKKYLDRLMVHLKPLERNGLIDIWQDTKIKTGDLWEEQITRALMESNIAILMISADFMASDFIVNNELPPLLSKAEVQGTKIVPVIISHCRFSREPMLNRFQAVNQPSEPLSVKTENEREAVYDKLASDIEAALNA